MESAKKMQKANRVSDFVFLTAKVCVVRKSFAAKQKTTHTHIEAQPRALRVRATFVFMFKVQVHVYVRLKKSA